MKKLLYLFSLLIVMGSCTLQASSGGKKVDPDRVVLEVISKFMLEANVQAAAVVLYYEGQLLFYSFGEADSRVGQPVANDTIFEIGSVTKTFTATLVAMEILRGKMQLKDPVIDYLPPQLKESQRAITRVTIEELATHTSGLPKVPPNSRGGIQQYSQEDFLNFIARWRSPGPAQAHYAYSNIGFGLLGYALQGASGKNYASLLQEDIFGPLGMTSSSLGYAVDDSRLAQGYSEGNPVPPFPLSAWPAGGAIRTTPEDMGQYLMANLGVNHGEDSTLLNAMEYTKRGLFRTNQFMQAMAWEIRPDGVITKAGRTNGFTCYVALVPDQKMGIVLFANQQKAFPARPINMILKELAGLSFIDTTED